MFHATQTATVYMFHATQTATVYMFHTTQTATVYMFHTTQTPTVSQNNFNRLAFVMDTHSVSCEVGTETVYNSAGSSVFCPRYVLMCFMWIWEQTAIISLYSIN
jgi:hypothetical protein